MNKFPFFQSVYTTYHGPTNSRGSRISIVMDKGYDKPVKYTASYDYAAHDAHDAAIERFKELYLKEWECVGKGHFPKGYVYLFEWK